MVDLPKTRRLSSALSVEENQRYPSRSHYLKNGEIMADFRCHPAKKLLSLSGKNENKLKTFAFPVEDDLTDEMYHHRCNEIVCIRLCIDINTQNSS